MDPHEQLWGAIGAVFGSWMNPRANTYRRLHDIPASWGTAVNVQAMVFGNMGSDCATGVCFTRDPSTGENIFYGEFLVNAQGEDVVAGIRTPQPLSKLRANPGEVSMEEALPSAYADLVQVRETLEKHYLDMQDIEFTVQQNKLYMLQTRNGKRTAQRRPCASPVEMIERKINRASTEALMRVAGLERSTSCCTPRWIPNAEKTLLTQQGFAGQPRCGATGTIVFNSRRSRESTPPERKALKSF